jgi:sulfite reductase beta subunit-like hemoprotein
MYTIYLGAEPHGTRLGLQFATNVKRNDVAPKLRVVLEHYKANRNETERFGDFCYRVGMPGLQDLRAAQPVH